MKSSNDLTRNGLLDQLCDSLESKFQLDSGNFALVIVRDGETVQQAVERDGFPPDDTRPRRRYQLIVDIHPKTVEQQIAEIEEELLSHGFTREKIEAEIGRVAEDPE